MDRAQAIKASKCGAYTAFISGSLTFLIFLFSYFGNTNGVFKFWNDTSIIFDVILIFSLGFGMLRKSRTAAVTIFIYFLLSKYYIFIETKKGINILSIIFLYYYAKAIQGTFVYHKIEKKQNPEYKKPAKCFFYIGIPVGIIIFGLMILGMIPESYLF